MKILIENTVPFNNGDVALIFSVGNEFKKLGHEVYYSSPNSKRIKKIYPNENWIESLISPKVIKIPILGLIILALKVMISKEYKEFNAIVSAPGGYINSFYTFKRRLQLMMFYKTILNKKIYMYSQSIGPFDSEGEKNFKKYIKYFDLFYVRDNISKKRADELGPFKNVIQTKDAAFLLDPIPHSEKKNKKIAVSVREWKFDGRSEQLYLELIIKIVNNLYLRGYDIVFISTCQGNSEYKNDALMAKKIYECLSTDVQKRTFVDDKFYNFYDLRKKLTEFDFTIGTRLHMCILSWLSGTPAINISYEEKGRECYHYLNLDNYSVDYNYQGDINLLISDFLSLNNYDDTIDKLKQIQIESIEHFENICKNITD